MDIKEKIISQNSKNKVHAILSSEFFRVASILLLLAAMALLVIFWKEGSIFSPGVAPDLSDQNNGEGNAILKQWRGGKPLLEHEYDDRERLSFFRKVREIADSVVPAKARPVGGFGEGNAEQAKVLLIGIDGADWALLTPLIEKGLMPNLAALLARSSYGPLSTDEANSPVSWTSIATGKQRGKTLSIGDSANPWEYDYRVVKVRRLWDLLAPATGKGLALINYYFMPPADVYPEGIIYDHDRFEGESSLKTILRVLKKQNPDFLFSIEKQTDELQHGVMLFAVMSYVDQFNEWIPANSWIAGEYEKKTEELIRLYKKIDKLVGYLLSKHSRDYIVLVSDHGFDIQSPTMNVDFESALQASYPERITVLNQNPGKAEAQWRFEGTTFEVTRKIRRWSFELFKQKESGKTQALILEVNEPQFCPSGSDAAGARTHLFSLLKEYSRQEKSPYLVHQEGDCVRIEASTNLVDYAIGQFSYQYNNHYPDNEGIVVLSGPRIAEGKIIKDAHLFDITPTLLYLKGYPVADDMDGRVLTQAIDPELLQLHPVQSIPTYETESLDGQDRPIKIKLTDEQRRHLRSLGYL